MYPASKVSFDLPSQEEEGNSASSSEILWSTAHPRKWMSQSSSFWSNRFFHWWAWSLTRITKYFRVHLTWQWWLLRLHTKSLKHHKQDLCSVCVVWQGYVLLPSDWSWQIAHLPNLPCSCKVIFRPWGTVPSWTNAFFVISPVNSLILIQIISYERMGINAYKVDMESKISLQKRCNYQIIIVCDPWHIKIWNINIFWQRGWVRLGYLCARACSIGNLEAACSLLPLPDLFSKIEGDCMQHNLFTL